MPATMSARESANGTSRAPLTVLADGSPACPTCGGRMWDNRATKRSPKAPDFKCRNRDCDGRVWPGQFKEPAPATASASPAGRAGQGSAPAAPASPEESRQEPATARRSLRACYLDVTEFVLTEVRPKYDAAGVPCTDATVAAITATLFIATCKGGGA